MRILMVSAYAPERNGIANYAVQSVQRLREQGHEVEVLSPGPSAAHHHLDLVGWRGPLALAKRVRDYDKVIVQFHPDFFYPLPQTGRDRVTVSLSLALAFRLARDLEVVAHEADYVGGRGVGLPALAMRSMWRSANKVLVHTEPERDTFIDVFRARPNRVGVIDHGADFVKRTSLDRAAARARLGLDPSQFRFLAIGFVQPHKGFDRAIRAFARSSLAASACRLDVVGSVRVEEPEFLDHLEELRELAKVTPGVEVHSGYVSDEEFDRWIVAADVVVLPYRHIWSSSVIERAALYERPVIASRVGGLANQARSTTTLVGDDEELASAMQVAAGRHLSSRGASAPDLPTVRGAWTDEDTVDRDRVMSEVRARAAARRGGPIAPTNTGPAAPLAPSASAPLRRLGPLRPAAPRGRATVVKRLAQRLTGWQLDPIIDHVNRLQSAAVRSTELLGSDGDDSQPHQRR